MLLLLFCVTVLLERFRCASKKMLMSLHRGLHLDASRRTCRMHLHHGVFLCFLIFWNTVVWVCFVLHWNCILWRWTRVVVALKKKGQKVYVEIKCSIFAHTNHLPMSAWQKMSWTQEYEENIFSIVWYVLGYPYGLHRCTFQDGDKR